jgi:hypothetical protein
MANEKQLVIEVRDKIATLKSKNFNLVGGNSDYDVVFDFDKDWDKDNVKTAIFVFGREKPVCKVFDGNVCEGIAINNATTCLIGVVAGDVRTTTSAVVDCVYRSIVDEAVETPEPPTEDVYNQIMELLNKYIQQGGGGSVSEEDIIRVIDKYLEEHPVKDGFSPTVSVEDIGNGHRVVITDKNGEHSFDLLNGSNGLTPFIGENGNWWIGDEDTGVKAEGSADGKYVPMPEENIFGGNLAVPVYNNENKIVYHILRPDEAVSEGIVQRDANMRILVRGDWSNIYDLEDREAASVDMVNTIANFAIDERLGDISTALDTLHEYAQSLVSGGEGE